VSDFLAGMLAASRARVAAARERTPLARPAGPRPRGRLREALERGVPAHDGTESVPMRVIAEVKRRSPSRGDLAPGLDAAAQALAYEAAGADAISVLTEPARFGGSLDDLRAVAAAVSIPVLRKDFVIDPYQVWEAVEAGAAGVLLIAAALPGERLGSLLDECHDCGLDALVEVHDRDELRRVCRTGVALIGVNNRDLRTLQVDLATTEELGPLCGRCTVLVSESGIATKEDAARVQRAGVHAVLVGEALVCAPRAELPALVEALRGERP
jgi:indole-3-glycerol phosphate synthase